MKKQKREKVKLTGNCQTGVIVFGSLNLGINAEHNVYQGQGY